MKIGIISANGKVGRLVVDEAIKRNFDVTAIVRGENKTAAQKEIVKGIFDLTLEDLKEFDVVVDAFGVWAAEDLEQHVTSLNHVSDILSGTNIRLLVVGGAGTLYVDEAQSIKVVDTPDCPEMFKPLVNAMGKGLENLRKRNDVKWTYISPACAFRVDREATGEYLIGGESVILNSNGESIIGYADYVLALVDEAEKGQNIQKRISVVEK
ncbi:NAD(P)-dependent oxidoreductase [uncultured Clostridium sp.]|jgi:hypothetical protein|uniref:NAD(P)-dependent oxidoreductase n=1 Tax=uncultured Clostridium sp. TaxID=59620 RepID=UPI00260A3744|nr:NAD(P)H-binding protein [uncultured Clostridium sp.]